MAEVDSNGVAVVYPTGQLWRVGRRKGPFHFSEITPEIAEDDQAGNRFDVLGGEVLYAATSLVGAYVETLQKFRPTTATRAATRQHQPHLMISGNMPRDWRERRVKAQFVIEDPLPFVDVEATESHPSLESHLSEELDDLGVSNLDVAIVRSERRLVTRVLATWAYLAEDPDTGESTYSGIRYVSKIGNHECWAIFDGVALSPAGAESIDCSDPALEQARQELNLVIH